jgi:hypothetical protein
MSEANRSSNVPLSVYEEILSAPKSSDQEATDLWDGVLALYRAEDAAKTAQEHAND